MIPLAELEQLKPLQSIKALQKEPPERLKVPLSEIELISYSTNLCLHSARILRGETIVTNREAKLNALNREISKMYSLLSIDDYYLHSTYTKQDTRKFFKELGIRSSHLKH